MEGTGVSYQRSKRVICGRHLLIRNVHCRSSDNRERPWGRIEDLVVKNKELRDRALSGLLVLSLTRSGV